MDQRGKWCKKLADKSLLGICLLTGMTGVIASKAITVLVVLGGTAGLISYLLIQEKRPQFFSSFTITLVLLLIWAGVSSSWSLNESGALILSFRLAALCLAGFFLNHASAYIPPNTRKTLQTTLLIGYGLGLFALLTGYVYAKTTDDSLWGGYYFDPLTTLNNGAIFVALIFWPVALIIWQKHSPLTAVLLFLVLSGGLIFLSSGASLLAIAVGGGVLITILLFGRPAGAAIAIVTTVLVLTAPFVTERITTSEVIMEITASAPPSAKHRLLMWNFVTEKIKDSPSWGLGMDSSRYIPQDDFRLDSNMEIMPLHPHNAALQIRLETGWPGIILASALILSLFWAILKETGNRQHMAIRLSVLCAYLSVGAVSYGVWQSWWIATAWALAMFVGIAAPTAPHEVRNREKTAG